MLHHQTPIITRQTALTAGFVGYIYGETMAISNFVAASLDCLQSGRYDVALALACSAVDATTAKTENKSWSNNKRYKSFLKKNMPIITTFGFPGIMAGGIEIKCINVPDLKTDSDGMVGIEDIIYHVIRCGLLHQCEIDKHIEFTEETQLGNYEKKFKVPLALVFVLLMSVVLNEVNKKESMDKMYSVPFGDSQKDINSLWGAKNKYFKTI